MAILYPKCPICSGTSESAEPDDFERGSRAATIMLRQAAHQHPYLKMVHLAAKAGREIYKRVPGGGQKRCSSPVCGHRFH